MARRRGVLALTLGAGAASAQNITYYDLTYAYSGMGPWSGCVSSSPQLFMMVDQTPDRLCVKRALWVRHLRYEEVQLIAALAGLVNRDEPRLVLNLEPTDAAWLAYSTAPGAWLANASVTPLAGYTAENVVGAFGAFFNGVVVYDPNVACTSCLANTAAGADDLLPVAYRPDDPGSLYARLVSGGPQLPVKLNLVGLIDGSKTGSVKRDCYDWGVTNFINTNKTDPTHLGYFVDYWWAQHDFTEGGGGWTKATIPNLDYVVAKRGFFFDLGVWDDEAPVDEPDQPLGADLAALRHVLRASYDASGGAILTIHGFTPWAYKCSWLMRVAAVCFIAVLWGRVRLM